MQTLIYVYIMLQIVAAMETEERQIVHVFEHHNDLNKYVKRHVEMIRNYQDTT